MKTTFICSLVAFLSFVLAGCADPNIGKPVDRYLPFNVSGSGHETVFFGADFILDYSYTVNEKDKTVTLTGTLNCNKDTADWNASAGKVRVKLISKKGIISDVHTLKSWSGEELCAEKSFDSTYPFQEPIDGVTFSFKAKMHE